MTSLVVWVACSKTGNGPNLPKAIYIASDSRITWGTQSQRWDSGRKIFGLERQPHMFGYCGDVVFPSLVLSQISSAIDVDTLFEYRSSAEEKHEAVFRLLQASFATRHNAPNYDFQIIHVFRARPWPTPTFHVWQISYVAATKAWKSEKVDVPLVTGVVAYLGTGARIAERHIAKWMKSDVGGTSRAVFAGFCDALKAGKDVRSGGAPQISGLYSDKLAPRLGVFTDGKFFLHGLELPQSRKLRSIAWRDELFRRVDPLTGGLTAAARRFARPAEPKP